MDKKHGKPSPAPCFRLYRCIFIGRGRVARRQKGNDALARLQLVRKTLSGGEFAGRCDFHQRGLHLFFRRRNRRNGFGIGPGRGRLGARGQFGNRKIVGRLLETAGRTNPIQRQVAGAIGYSQPAKTDVGMVIRQSRQTGYRCRYGGGGRHERTQFFSAFYERNRTNPCKVSGKNPTRSGYCRYGSKKSAY